MDKVVVYKNKDEGKLEYLIKKVLTDDRFNGIVNIQYKTNVIYNHTIIYSVMIHYKTK